MFKKFIVAAAAVASLTVGAQRVDAVPFTYTAGSDSLVGDTNSSVTEWNYQGLDHLFREAWVVRTSAGAVLLTGGTLDAADNTLITYTFDGWTILMDHTFTGAAWSTTFDLTRGANATSNLNLYTYADYDLSETIGGETVNIIGSGLGVGFVTQIDERTTLAYTSTGMNFWDATTYGTGMNAQVGSGFSSNLDFNANLLNRPNSFGDAVFATQLVATSSNSDFSIDRRLSVPEPASVVLLGLGLLGAARAARRRRE